MFGHVVHVLGPVWSARLISLTTIFVEIIADTFAFGRKIGHSTVHWLSGSSRRWVFMRDNIGPVPSSAVYDYKINPNVTWHFDLAGTDLTFVDPNVEYEEENVIIEPRQLPWLSAKIVYNKGEYEIDDFASEFNYVAPRGVKPTPKLILNCWSIWSGIWLMPGQDARFEIINSNGEEESYLIHSRPASEVDRWGELFEVEEDDDKSDSEPVEEGEEEAKGEGEEKEESEGEEEGEEEGDESTDDEDTNEVNVSNHSGDSAADELSERHSSPELVEDTKED